MFQGSGVSLQLVAMQVMSIEIQKQIKARAWLLPIRGAEVLLKMALRTMQRASRTSSPTCTNGLRCAQSDTAAPLVCWTPSTSPSQDQVKEERRREIRKTARQVGIDEAQKLIAHPLNQASLRLWNGPPAANALVAANQGSKACRARCS